MHNSAIRVVFVVIEMCAHWNRKSMHPKLKTTKKYVNYFLFNTFL